jgi:molybdopterin-guanine dinucleotide biosynthesis protein A
LLPPLPPRVQRADDPPELAGGGPLVGVATGLAALPPEGLVFCGSVDAPLVTSGHVTCVLDVLEGHPEAQAVVPVSEDGRMHPLAGAVRLPAAKTAAERLLAQGERRLMALFEAGEVVRVHARDLPSPDVLLPCNSLEDWRRLRRLRGWM